MIRQIIVFLCVGIVATALHLIVGAALLHMSVNPYLANSVGFASAFLVSFLGHQTLTFKATHETGGGAFLRYLVTAISGYFVHQTAFFALMNVVQFEPITSMLFASIGSASLTYALARRWAFRVKVQESN